MKLKQLTYRTPIHSNVGIDIHVRPEENRTYMLTADVSRGTANDYSAFVVFDVLAGVGGGCSVSVVLFFIQCGGEGRVGSGP